MEETGKDSLRKTQEQSVKKKIQKDFQQESQKERLPIVFFLKIHRRTSGRNLWKILTRTEALEKSKEESLRESREDLWKVL